MNGFIARLDARSSGAARFLALAGLVGLVVLTVITIADVLMRWLFNSPIDGVADIARLIVAINIAAFFPLALAERHHIAIGFLGKALGPRIHAWLEVLASLVTSVFFLALGWQFILYTDELQASGETTWLLGIPVAPWWAVVTLFLLICIPVQLIVFLARWRAAMAGAPEDSGDGSAHSVPESEY
ncbi:MAG: TRAP transporter small permease [Rhodospirillales bacterium]|jgi:TRAP-type C4-dicarboxylate transport system permease small subunit|nr:hypothetical protein [Rhodospirillaceae bacterium]MDP6427169.1 TRAP transporter small permease [Rhodospirillales bacterium]MDP6646563.1 TRAP transporter small permease [Rhodospirillales bacterium]MDP6840964.1 TRAP transporter small permease [Rhodospirillales bacterium]|tara:strand:+ start:453 stop:1007 length:555 start_codon:yes stop_codon:yes gene_type:complete